MRSLGALLLTAAIVSGHIIRDLDEAPPLDYESVEGLVWPSEYHFQALKIDLSVGSVIPIKIWFSAELNRSRISYYDGLDTTYYYAETDEDMGHSYQVNPITDEDLDEDIQCNDYGHDGDAVDFLPEVEDYSYSEDIIYNKKTVAVWIYRSSNENTTDVDTLYVFRGDREFDVPVRYESKSYNAWTKALTKHTITDFYNYQLPDSDDLDAMKVESCNYAVTRVSQSNPFKHHHGNTPVGMEEGFKAYKHQHRRVYRGDEHEMRRKIFEKNWWKVVEHNKKNLSYKLAVNRFSDRTPEELRPLAGTFPNPLGRGSVRFPYSEDEVQTLAEDLPENYDMRLDGVISRVKNQGDCGSCWAFSTTAAVEGALARSNGGRDINLSEQSVVDCAWGFNNYGCNGGLLDTAFKYILHYGIPTETDYGPYLVQDGNCSMHDMNAYKIKGFARVTPGSVNAMRVALHKYGPVSVAIYASDTLTMYSNGVFYDTECTESSRINHAVTVVGYGVRDGTLHWIIKNSWGEDWGQDGYLLLSSTNDNCLTLTEAYYPIL